MADRRFSDNLFESSTMTFGEHLDELRQSLVKALTGLLIGCLIGLAVADRVVKLIEMPLRHALENFYVDKDILSLEEEAGKELEKDFEAFIREHGLIADDFLVERSEAKRMQSALAGPEMSLKELVEQKLPFPTQSFVKVRVWRLVETRITSLNAQEAFMIWLKAAFVTGLILSSPWVFWHIWQFVAAGLYPHERRYVYVYLPFSIILFLAGSSMAFFFVFEPVLAFLFQFNQWMDIDPDPRISEWVGFVLFLPIGFGVAFQLPLVMLFINRIGVFSVEQFLEKWRIAILAIFVLSMLLTPADPVSMLMMAVPLTILYFLGIGLCQWMPRGRSLFDFDEEVDEP